MAEAAANAVVDNAARGRFELAVEGGVAFAEYQRGGGAGRAVRDVYHVETPPALRGSGVASKLMEGILAHARAEDFRIIPTCSYAAAWFARRPDARDRLA